MMSLIGRIYSSILTGCVVIAGGLIMVSIALVIFDVTVRAFGMRPPGFTVAFVEYILLYFVLLSAPYLVREKGHVFTDMLVSQFGPRTRMICEKLVYLICIIISIVFAVVGGMLFHEGYKFGYVDERSIDIPYWALYVLYPLCFSMIAIEFARFLWGADSLYARDQQLDSV
jgi:TRAP-type C4-dicarboxylate transport system permease small subunit